MPPNEYTPEQALQMIMQKLATVSRELADTVQTAVDAGKDVQAAEPDNKGRTGTREYRKTVPYTYEEATHVALSALEAYFVINPLMRNSCSDNFVQTALGEPRRSVLTIEKGQHFAFDGKSVGINKVLQIELRTETQLLPGALALQIPAEVYAIQPVSASDIQSEMDNFTRLRKLLKFE